MDMQRGGPARDAVCPSSSSDFLKDATNRASFLIAVSVPECLKDATKRASFLIAVSVP